MKELRRPEYYSDSYGTLYNDMLILKSIVTNVPQSLYVELLRELNSLEMSMRENQHPGFLSQLYSEADRPRKVSLERIMRVLAKVECKDVLLEDFLICSGYTTKQSVITN
jgi:hypothetical protein